MAILGKETGYIIVIAVYYEHAFIWGTDYNKLNES